MSVVFIIKWLIKFFKSKTNISSFEFWDTIINILFDFYNFVKWKNQKHSNNFI
jgi:hypothetical protein